MTLLKTGVILILMGLTLTVYARKIVFHPAPPPCVVQHNCK